MTQAKRKAAAGTIARPVGTVVGAAVGAIVGGLAGKGIAEATAFDEYEPARPGIMSQPPRSADASILTGRRLGRLALYGLTMAAGTLAA